MGRTITGALLLVVGLAWLVQSAGWVEFPARSLLAIALIVVGVGLVAGSRYGSYPGLIVIGAILTVILMDASPRGYVNVTGERGASRRDRVVRPSDPDDLKPYRINAGQLVIDLSRLDLNSGTNRVQGRVGAGKILVRVPAGVPIRVNASTGTGSIFIFGDERASGIGSKDTYESPNYDTETPRVSMQLRAAVGSIRVERTKR
jgi:hypothetical protein